MKAISLLNDLVDRAVTRDHVYRMELLQGVNSPEQIILPKNSWFAEQPFEKILSMSVEYVTCDDGNAFLANYHIDKSLHGFARSLPTVHFKLDTPCSNCGHTTFYRRVTGRSEYRAGSHGQYHGFANSNIYHCANPWCQAQYDVEDGSHNHNCECRECARKDGRYPLVHLFKIPEHWQPFCTLSVEQKRLLKANVALAGPTDVSARECLAKVFWDALIMLTNVYRVECRSQMLRGPFLELNVNQMGWTKRLYRHNASTWTEVQELLGITEMGPLRMDLLMAMAIVQSLLADALPDDHHLIAEVSEYCIAILRSDDGWQRTCHNLKSNGARKIFERIKEQFEWDESIAQYLVTGEYEWIDPLAVDTVEINAFREATINMLNACSSRKRALETMQAILAEQGCA